MLPQDNNGVIVQLPSVPLGGMPFVNGSLILGIDTQSNNASAGATSYGANTSAQFSTLFSSKSYNSFIDSGSNGLFFAPPTSSPITICSGINSGWFCPSSTLTLSATNVGAAGAPNGLVTFYIGNYTSLTGSTTNKVFSEIGGNFFFRRAPFDWGLPFFFGRSVFVGFESRISNLGSGPYWDY